MGAVLGAALLALVASCSTTEQGTATAGTVTPTGGSTKSAPPSSTSSSTSSSAPPVSRPRTIDLKSTDGCKIMQSMAADFGWTGKTTSDFDSLGFPGNKECIVTNSAKKETVSITGVTNKGVPEYTHDGRGGDLAPIRVAGFPAYTFTPKTAVSLPGISGRSCSSLAALYTAG
ncbi:hypothetical protein ACFQ1S_32065 [Kibdelosporangium lantanae]|uniref:DUF3558 domain-containing protein n=1 Tax=Kibdelosporangium lantanae TaxID=1497396 RepID=A0ABW3MHH6_9PSEU